LLNGICHSLSHSLENAVGPLITRLVDFFRAKCRKNQCASFREFGPLTSQLLRLWVGREGVGDAAFGAHVGQRLVHGLRQAGLETLLRRWVGREGVSDAHVDQRL
jgi:uncharacterized protein YidB (DUF937 family)